MAICAFLGLGVMGYPMAGHLVAAGHRHRVQPNDGESRAMGCGARWGNGDDSGCCGRGAEYVFCASVMIPTYSP